MFYLRRLKEVKDHLLLTVSCFAQALLCPRNDAVLKNQQPLLKTQKPAVCFASIASAVLTSMSCKYTAWPVTAHITSKEKYSQFLFLPLPFSVRYTGMQHHQHKHTLLAVDVNFFIIYYILFSNGEKWGREEKKTRVGWQSMERSYQHH